VLITPGTFFVLIMQYSSTLGDTPAHILKQLIRVRAVVFFNRSSSTKAITSAKAVAKSLTKLAAKALTCAI